MFDIGVKLGSKTALDLESSLQKSDFKKQVYELVKAHYYTKLVCVSNDLSIFFFTSTKRIFFPKTRILFHSKFISSCKIIISYIKIVYPFIIIYIYKFFLGGGGFVKSAIL